MALEALRANEEILIGIATGKSRRGLVHTLHAHGLTGFFDTLQTADEHPSKPHPSMLAACLSETGAEAADSVIVGDSIYDIEMGRAAGFSTIGVSWGYHAPDMLVAAGADAILTSFEGLPEALQQIWGPE